MKNGLLGLVMLVASVAIPARAAESKMAAPPAGEGHAMHAMKGADMTCGQMVAGHAPIPEKLAEGATSAAEMFEAHAALMGKEKEAMAEAKGMRAIAKSHRQVAAELKKVADEMKKAASWPAAPHDMAKMGADPKLMAAQKKFIEVHKEIIALFQKAVADLEAQQKAAAK